jgi:predicted AAA+ superfamily ATPase
MRYTAHPELLEELLLANPTKKIVIIDEVQKIPALLNVVHSYIETEAQSGVHQTTQFILTGSSSRKLKSVGVDLLAGRAVVRRMHPLLPIELGGSFDLERALRWGLIPLIWKASNPSDRLNAYLGLYLKEEVKVEALVKDMTSFSNFLEVISFSQASPINQSQIASDCGIERKTVQRYLEILVDLNLSVHLPIFSKRAKRELVTKEKFYFCRL